jgi:parallel beta-helix repeat protein
MPRERSPFTEGYKKMKSKAVSGIMLTLLSIGMLTLAFNIQPVRAIELIYIKADGSVDPDTAPISSVDNVTYTFTGNINGSIVVERDNIVVDGAGYTLRGDGGVAGIRLENRHNVTIKNKQITHFGNGIELMGNGSQNNTIIGNNITANGHETYGNGIWVAFDSSHNTISGNNITNNWEGVFLYMAGGNIISENYITGNRWHGVWIYAVNNSIVRNDIINNSIGVLVEIGSNIVHHNNFVNNTVQTDIDEPIVSIWDDGYPSGGNYWNDYIDEDQYSGPYQNETGSDGIWDHPYVIDENNQDNYPVVPEFPAWTSMLLILIVLTVAITIHKRRLLKTPIH